MDFNYIKLVRKFGIRDCYYSWKYVVSSYVLTSMCLGWIHYHIVFRAGTRNIPIQCFLYNAWFTTVSIHIMWMRLRWAPQIITKIFTENWVSKQSFFVLILTMAYIFFRNKTFLFFKIESWNLISNRCWKFQLSILKNKKNYS